MTLQQYLMDHYGVSKESLGIRGNSPDGFPGPKTIAQLNIIDGNKPRYQKMNETKLTFTKTYTPDEVSISVAKAATNNPT